MKPEKDIFDRAMMLSHIDVDVFGGKAHIILKSDILKG